MRRVVVEDRKSPRIRAFRQADPLLPCRMSPADAGEKLVLRVSAIVDEQVGVARKPDNILVKEVGAVLGIGDISDGVSVIFKPISGGAARMIERTRVNRVVGPQDQGRARQKESDNRSAPELCRGGSKY